MLKRTTQVTTGFHPNSMKIELGQTWNLLWNGSQTLVRCSTNWSTITRQKLLQRQILLLTAHTRDPRWTRNLELREPSPAITHHFQLSHIISGGLNIKSIALLTYLFYIFDLLFMDRSIPFRSIGNYTWIHCYFSEKFQTFWNSKTQNSEKINSKFFANRKCVSCFVSRSVRFWDVKTHLHTPKSKTSSVQFVYEILRYFSKIAGNSVDTVVNLLKTTDAPLS